MINLHGLTILMEGAWKGHHECVDVLIETGADVNAAITDGSNEGTTPLIQAPSVASTESIKLL